MLPNTPCSNYNGIPKCYLNKTTQTHVSKHTHTHRPKQTRKTDCSQLFPFIGPQSFRDVYTLVISRPLWSSPYSLEICVHSSLCEYVCLCVHVSVLLEAPAPLNAVPGTYQLSCMNMELSVSGHSFTDGRRNCGDNLKQQQSIVSVSGMYL